MNLLDKLKEKTKSLTDEAEKKAGAAPEHGFLDAVKEGMEAPAGGSSAPREATVDDVYRDLMQRKQKGEMPRNPAEALMDVLGKPPASEVFASGAVFELSRQYRDHFLKALQSSDDRKLFELFRATFTLFMDQPESAGIQETAFNKKNEDTDPLTWIVSSSSAPDGAVALCRMPVKSKTLSERLAGIVFRDAGDRYYYCMLNKDRNMPSEILRYEGSVPPVQAGVISGDDPEAADTFLRCVREATTKMSVFNG